jgi:hypothetical protein
LGDSLPVDLDGELLCFEVVDLCGGVLDLVTGFFYGMLSFINDTS